MTHKNGDRMFGSTPVLARDREMAGTPVVSSLRRSTVTDAVARVRVGQRLDVKWCGTHWEVWSRGVLLGRLTWSAKRRGEPHPVTGTPLWDVGDGVLHVERVIKNDRGVVVNLGGYVVPIRQ